MNRVHNSRRPLDRLFAFFNLTVWPWSLTFWPNINWWAIWFGDFSFSRFGGFVVWTDSHTETQTESQTPLNPFLTWLVGVI